MENYKGGMFVTALAVLFLFAGCGSSSYLQTKSHADEGSGRVVLETEDDHTKEGTGGDADIAYDEPSSGEDIGKGGTNTSSDGEYANPSNGGDAVVYVQVAGAVSKPDVYKFPVGSRVFEAIEHAGGFLPEAYDGDLNLASVLTDGQKIYVPTKDEQASLEASAKDGRASLEANTNDDGRVNINTATEAELMTLPGIGQSKAALIIQYRETHGGFSSIEEIKKIEGIKEGTYSKICENIKI